MKKVIFLLATVVLMSNTAFADKPNYMKRYNPANNPLNQPAPAQQIDESLKSNTNKYGRECIYDEKTMWKVNEDGNSVTVYLGAWGKGSMTLSNDRIGYDELLIRNEKYGKGALKENGTQFEICKLPN